MYTLITHGGTAHDGTAYAGTVRRDDPVDTIVTAVVAGGHILLPATLELGLLDAIASRLAGACTRVLRPATQGTLTLAGLLADIAGHKTNAPLSGLDLERGFELLTGTGPEHGRPGCDRIVLMLDRADALDAAALRYLQLAARGTVLQLLFSAGPGLRALLEWEEFGHLRRGFVEHPFPQIEAPFAIQAPVPIPGLKPAQVTAIEQPSPTDPAPFRRGRWVLAGVGAAVVASIAGILRLIPAETLAAYVGKGRALSQSLRTVLLP